MAVKKSLIVAFLSVLEVYGACNLPSQVQTSVGCFQGAVNSSTDIESFLGVPFAKPPVGSLRFKAPVPIAPPLPGVQDATKFGDACVQVV